MVATTNLKSMSLDKLSKLREQVEAALASKISETRRMLESQLGTLTGFGIGSPRSQRGSLRGRTVAPKYRNPEIPSETWAGRGLKPRWLAAALKAGKKLESFSINSAAKKGTKKVAKNKSLKRQSGTARKARMGKTRAPRAATQPATSSPNPAGAAQT